MHSSVLSWLDPGWLLSRFGPQMFLVSVLMVFVECGLLFPFLPGDSLLFSIGLFIRRAELGQQGLHLNLAVACVLLSLVAFLGNVFGYQIGRALGPTAERGHGWLLNPRHLQEARVFFQRHGSAALVLGRFVPVVRTFITLVAGVSRMDRRPFLLWSFVGAVAWASGVTLLGYALGTVPLLQQHIDVVLIVLVALSLLPAALAAVRRRHHSSATGTVG